MRYHISNSIKIYFRNFFKIVKIKWIKKQCRRATCLTCKYKHECLQNLIE
nr:MAG TPA: hypothetical protein [Caudoviricetes sp.]